MFRICFLSQARIVDSQQKQADRVLKYGAERLVPLKVNDSCRIPVPDVDRSRATPRNLIGIVLEEKTPGKLRTA